VPTATPCTAQLRPENPKRASRPPGRVSLMTLKTIAPASTEKRTSGADRTDVRRSCDSSTQLASRIFRPAWVIHLSVIKNNATVTKDDIGKRVISGCGDEVGRVVGFDGGSAQISPGTPTESTRAILYSAGTASRPKPPTDSTTNRSTPSPTTRFDSDRESVGLSVLSASARNSHEVVGLTVPVGDRSPVRPTDFEGVVRS